jgi:hypothetical protein
MSKPTECCEKIICRATLDSGLARAHESPNPRSRDVRGEGPACEDRKERIRAVATTKRLRAGAHRVLPMVVSGSIAVQTLGFGWELHREGGAGLG